MPLSQELKQSLQADSVRDAGFGRDQRETRWDPLVPIWKKLVPSGFQLVPACTFAALHHGPDKARATLRSWYTLYASGCVLALFAGEFVYILMGTRNEFQGSHRSTKISYILIYGFTQLKVAVNVATSASKASQFLEFFRAAQGFERDSGFSTVQGLLRAVQGVNVLLSTSVDAAASFYKLKSGEGIFLSAVFTAYQAVDFVELSMLSQAMVNEASRMKAVLKTMVIRDSPECYIEQVRFLYDAGPATRNGTAMRQLFQARHAPRCDDGWLDNYLLRHSRTDGGPNTALAMATDFS
ncbi:hypothetical protein MTO96_022335 [Rhipicephalus appendiculatus]